MADLTAPLTGADGPVGGAKGDDDDVRTGENMARDPERLGQPQRLDGYVQLQPCHQ